MFISPPLVISNMLTGPQMKIRDKPGVCAQFVPMNVGLEMKFKLKQMHSKTFFNTTPHSGLYTQLLFKHMR